MKKPGTVHLFFRKKTPGFNSIEVVFEQLVQFDLTHHKRLKTYMVPHKGISAINLATNLIYCFRRRGVVNHISGDIQYIAMALGKNTLLTIHDVQSILNHPNRIIRYFLTLLWFRMPSRICKKISFISEFSREEFLNIFPKHRHKTLVISNPAPIIPEEIIRFKKELVKKRDYDLEILSVGTKWNKNLERVIEAVKGANYRLHIVGSLSSDQQDALERKNIDFENYTDLPYMELLKLYASVDVVSFPSLYEGFGMPILEAQGVGVPVVVGNRCAMPEITGEGGLVVDPEDVNSIGDAFSKLEDKKLREALVKKGMENIRRFDVSRIYKQYEEVYAELGS